MTKEVRSIFLAGLTLVVYAVIGFFKDSTLVFPFPLNESIFLIITIQFAYWYRGKGSTVYLFLLTALFGVLSNPFIWEILLSIESLQQFFGYPLIYWFQFLFGAGIIGTGIVFLNKQKQLLASFITGTGLALFGYGFYFGIPYMETIGFGLVLISTSLHQVFKPLHLLWVLLFILSLTETITFLIAR